MLKVITLGWWNYEQLLSNLKFPNPQQYGYITLKKEKHIIKNHRLFKLEF